MSSASASLSSVQNFGLDELEQATNNFDEAKVIGRGDFGTTYEGLLHDGRTVAVKRYNIDGNVTEKFHDEVKILSKCHSNHLISIIGKCEDSLGMILVHEFMKNGTLEDHLSDDQGREAGCTLTWEQRLRICIDVAKGLQYLHQGPANSKRIIHRNLNPGNILLDENWSAKISEFGYGKKGPAHNYYSDVHNEGKDDAYRDPHFNLTGRLNARSDIYAFGVVLTDVLFGLMDGFSYFRSHERKMLLRRRITECLNDGSLDGYVDKRLKGQISPQCLKEFVQLASHCLFDNPADRPTITLLLDKLHFILEISHTLPI